MNRIELWIIILGGMAVTYLIRLTFIIIIPPDRLPEWVRRGLRYVPPAVLAALIVPDLLLLDGTLHLSFANHRLIAGSIAGLVAWRSRNTWLTIVSGLLTFGLLTLL
ncbi:MAG: AzlD domain-containing protein [Anaerolineales bacterium]|nr:AzlD domain-containing protein [Anaerolineales bacterium]MCK5634194.1 AzlD domain-containing protein [Anaerolineales bacterium]